MLQSKTKKEIKEECCIKEYIESLGIDVIANHIICGITIGLYIPSKTLAIEFNRLLHSSSSEIATDKHIAAMHIDKTAICEENDVSLLHIFENEWENRQSIWKSMIKYKLGLSKKIHGRKTVCRDITSKLADEFCKTNHMQGTARAKYHYGLYYDNELVAVMCISSSRYNDNDFEIIRFCNIKDHTVVGGFTKLLNHFRSTHTGTIVSYANRRWSNGNLYKRSGFKQERITGPCYYYLSNGKMQHRSTYMKHKLQKLLNVFDPNKTEVENMYKNGYRRIWDCGTIVYTL